MTEGEGERLGEIIEYYILMDAGKRQEFLILSRGLLPSATLLPCPREKEPYK